MVVLGIKSNKSKLYRIIESIQKTESVRNTVPSILKHNIEIAKYMASNIMNK